MATANAEIEMKKKNIHGLATTDSNECYSTSGALLMDYKLFCSSFTFWGGEMFALKVVGNSAFEKNAWNLMMRVNCKRKAFKRSGHKVCVRFDADVYSVFH